ncbi:MAG: ATP-dependent DNA helicase RecG [Nannocystales bacterium]
MGQPASTVGTSTNPSQAEAWATLHASLRNAMVDGFAGIAEPGLAERVLSQADSWIGTLPDVPTEIRRWRARLDGFERLGRQDRSVLVARGMRLGAASRPPPEVAPKPRRQKTSEPEAKVTRTRGRKPRGASSPKTTTKSKTKTKSEAPAEAPSLDPVFPRIDSLSGVGPATAKKLEARGLESVVDLAYVLPSGYDDRRHRKPVDSIEDGEVAVIEGEVGSIRQGFARGRFLASVEIRVMDDDGTEHTVLARWFHRMGGLEKWAGGTVLAVGPARWYKGQLSLAHPELRDPSDPGPAIGVRYPSVEGVAPRTLAKVVRAAVKGLGDVPGFVDALPADIASEAGLPGQLDALRQLHLPDDDADEEVVDALVRGASEAHRRLAFDEFFFFQLALLRERAQHRSLAASLTLLEGSLDPEMVRAALPFEPTGAQWRVLDELVADMASGQPMMRLLQGDVGSGKTAVAFCLAMAAATRGSQTALMAPTEVLADQHLRTLRPWCEAAGLRIDKLTGSTPRAERTSKMALLASGKIDLLVGTHALLTDDVHFSDLGLVVVDEQHRFGVEQRAILRHKGDQPHLLVMTATPIPRTMALCAYGQLDVSVIDEMPPGREPTLTKLYTGKRGLGALRRAVAKAVGQDRQVFVVCPLVEASDALEATDVEATAAELRSQIPQTEIVVVHGRMSSKDKESVMSRFREGDARVLVATTVIEVGVDVPAATVMAIEHAERFGLAQLHQLRGRVGRGGGKSFCLLHASGGPQSDAAKRIGVLTETGDGFAVAERDLEFRGPGEVFGTRQAGAPRLRFTGFAGEGTKLLVAAREAAGGLLERDPGLSAHPEVVRELARRGGDAVARAADAG